MLLYQSMLFIMYKKKKKKYKKTTPLKTTTQVQIKFDYQINYALIIHV